MVDLRAEAAKGDWTVLVRDAVSVGLCARNGVMVYLSERGFDTRDVLRHGMSARTLLSLNDAQVDRAVMAAWKRLYG